MARVAVIGGHGKVALLATPLLVEGGHEVTSVIRNPDQRADVEATGATARVADVESLDISGLGDLLRGHDAVVWSAGAGGGNPQRTYALDRDAAIRTMDAALRAGVRRFVMVSYFGAGPEHGTPADSSFFPYAEAKSAADAHLAGTGLDWTILRPSRLTSEPGTGRVSVGADQPKGEVSRANVAAAVVAVLSSPATVHRTYEFNDGDTPLTDVFG